MHENAMVIVIPLAMLLLCILCTNFKIVSFWTQSSDLILTTYLVHVIDIITLSVSTMRYETMYIQI